MRAVSVLVGMAGCVLSAAIGCASTPSTGGGGSGGGSESSGAGVSSSNASGASGSASVSGSSGSSSGSGTGPAAVCNDCSGKVFTNDAACAATLQTCQGEMDPGGCSAWLACTKNCLMTDPPDASCFSVCDLGASMGGNTYVQVRACVCDNCKTECTFACQ